MHVIYWLVLILGISIVGMGLAFANTYIRNEEMKNDMIDKAYMWKAKQEKIATQQEEEERLKAVDANREKIRPAHLARSFRAA
jgi:hypothetical protein